MNYDVIIAGCGPAGATAATLLSEQGFSVLVFEKDRFPRFQIGESLLPYNSGLFERLGLSRRIEASGFVPKHGAEFVTGDGARSARLAFGRYLPDELSRAWQVRRSEFDALLMERAREAGADIRQGMTVRSITQGESGVTVVAAGAGDESLQVTGRFFIDASGPGVLSRLFGVEQRIDPELRKVAIFGHYTGAEPAGDGRDAGNIVIAVLRDGWTWSIPLGDDLTSFGLVVDSDELGRSGSRPAELLQRAISASPLLRRRFGRATLAGQVRARKDFSFMVDRMQGESFVLTGDAAGFIDPIFSTGVLIAMQSAEMAAEAVRALLREGRRGPLTTYEKRMRTALGRYRRMIRHFYRREFMEVFLDPQETLGIEEVVLRLLSGDAFEKESRRWKMELFYGLVYLQRITGSIAPRVPWDTLPGVFATAALEENVGRPAAETTIEGTSDRAAELRGYGS